MQCLSQVPYKESRELVDSKSPDSPMAFSKAFLKARGGRGVLGYVISSCTVL